MNITQFLTVLKQDPQFNEFTETITVIDKNYIFTPTAFSNGEIENSSGENNGSCKIFAFAKLQDLNEEHTLACFGKYYFDDVLKNPEGKDHQNIRNFMTTGWSGIHFSGNPLAEK